MRKWILFASLISCGMTAKAQSSPWSISFTPAIVATTEPHYGLQLGGGYRFNDRLDLLAEFTVITDQKADSSTYQPHYFRIKPELRYSFAGRKKIFEPYTGLQLSYTFRKWKNIDGGSYFEKQFYEDSAITFQSASVNSPVFTSSAQLGAVITIAGNFGIDIFTGLGVRVINTAYSDVQGNRKVPAQQPKCKILIAPDPAWWVNGPIARVHFNTGLRLLYRF